MNGVDDSAGALRGSDEAVVHPKRVSSAAVEPVDPGSLRGSRDAALDEIERRGRRMDEMAAMTVNAETERDRAIYETTALHAALNAVLALCDIDDARRVPGALHVSRLNAEEVRAAATVPPASDADQ